MKRFFHSTISIGAIFCLVIGATLISCKAQEPSEGKAKGDSTAAQTPPPAPAPDSATLAQMDKEIETYLVAADSLVIVFQNIKTMKDVEKSADRIRQLSVAMQHFIDQSARYGQPFVEREGMAKVSSLVDRLSAERERLQKDRKLYDRILEIENEGRKPNSNK